MSDDVTEAGRVSPEEAPRRKGPRLLALLPVLLFGALAAVFLMQLLSGEDASEVPSVLIGKPAPETQLPPLEGVTGPDGGAMPALDLAQWKGEPFLLNVFASWCGPCRVEHPILMELSKDERFDLLAINYKDKPENARAFLADLGNPYDAIGVDRQGAATIDWGVYGVPESFLVGPDGNILWKQTGPFTPQAVENGLMPALEKALADRPTS